MARTRNKTSSLAEISEVKRPNLGPSTQFLLIIFSKHHDCYDNFPQIIFFADTCMTNNFKTIETHL